MTPPPLRRVRLLLALLAPTGALAAQPAQPATDTTRFAGEIAAFAAADSAHPPAPGGTLFVGSSTIRLWPALDRDFPALHPIDRGFGGSTMPDLLYRADRIVFPYAPRTIVLYEGDNDLAEGRTPTQVGDDVARFAALVRRRLPDARLVVISVKPSPARLTLMDRMRDVNARLRALAARDPRVTFVDLFTPMLGPDGRPRPELYGPDGLHMSPAGYALWRARLAPVLGER